MSLIKWNDSFSVNVVKVDQEHKKLIAMVNDLTDAMKAGKGKDVLGKILDDRKKMIDQAEPETAKLYSTQMEYFDREVKNLPGIEAIEVAKVIAEALSNSKPKAQYLVGPGAKKMKMLARFPRAMRDNMLYRAIYN